MAYTDVGVGPTVILIHGFGGSMWHWEYQQSLSSHFRVITPDLIGSGFSDKPDLEYSPDQVLKFFIGFMDALQIAHSTLIGHSMGCGVAIATSLTYPDRVEKLILLSGFPDKVRDRLTNPMYRKALESRLPLWISSLGNRLLGRSFTRSILRQLIYDPTLLTPAVIERSYQNRQLPGILAPQMALIRNLHLWESGFATRIQEVSHRTFIIWGAKDKLFPLAVGENISSRIRGARFYSVQGAGHMVQWEKPDTVNRLLQEFMVE
jgi:pimeloyl-ACP methyl ester carboxylesterase